MKNKFILGILCSAEYLKSKGELSITYFTILKNALYEQILDKATYSKCLKYVNEFLKEEYYDK